MSAALALRNREEGSANQLKSKYNTKDKKPEVKTVISNYRKIWSK